MEDNSGYKNNTIMGALGTMTLWTGAGATAYYGYKFFSDSSEKEHEYSNIKKSATVKSTGESIKPTDILINPEDVGLKGYDNFKKNFAHRYTNMDVALKNNAENISAKQAELLKQIFDTSEANSVVVYKHNGQVFDMSIHTRRGTLKVGSFTDPINKIVHPSGKGGYASPFFLSKENTRRLAYGLGDVDLAANNAYVNFTTAKLEFINDSLRNAPIRTINENILSFDSKHIISQSESTFNKIRKFNTITPSPFYNEDNKLIDFNPFQKETKNYSNNFLKSIEGDSRVVNSPTAYQNSKNIQNAMFSHPYKNPYGKIPIFQVPSIEGGHKTYQGFTKPTRIINPIMYSEEGKTLAEHSNITSIQTLYAKDDAILNKMFESGFGNNGIALPKLTDEGFYASKELANRVLETPMQKTIKLNNTKLTQEMDVLADHIFRKARRVQSINKSSIFVGPLLEATETSLSDLIKSGQIKKVIGDGLDLSEIFSGSGMVNLGIGESGYESLPKNAVIKNMWIDPKGGIGVDFVSRNKASDNAIKMWGNRKAIEVGTIDTREIGSKWIAFKRYSIENVNGESEILNLLSALKDKNTSVEDRKIIESKLNNIANKYGNIKSKLSKDFIITSQEERNEPILQSLKSVETEAMRKQTGWVGDFLEQTVATMDKGPEAYGTGIHSAVEVNDIMSDKLRGINMDNAANFIEGKFQHDQYKYIYDSFLPHVKGRDLKGYHGIDIRDISMSDIDILYNGNIDEVSQLLENMFGHKNVSDTTKYYIKISKEITGTETHRIPIMREDSRFSGMLDIFTHDRNDKIIPKQLTSLTRRYVSDMKVGRYNTGSYRELEKVASGLLGNRGVFSRGYAKSGMLLQYKGENFLDVNQLKSFSNQKGVKEVLKKHGLSYKILENKSVHGVNDTVYKAKLNRLPESLRNTDIYEIIARDPIYSHEGAAISKLINMSDFLTDLLNVTGPDEDKLREFVNSSLNDNQLFMNTLNKNRLGADLDNDIIKTISIDDKKSYKPIASDWKEYESPLNEFYTGKGTFKTTKTSGKYFGNSRAGVVESSQIEGKYISQVFNKSIPYQNHVIDIDGVFKGNAKMVAKKQAVISDLFKTMPEMVIGGKTITSEEEAQNLLKIMDSSHPMEERISILRELGESKYQSSKMKHNIFSKEIMSDSEISSFLSKGDRVHSILKKHLSKNIESFSDLENIFKILEESGTNTGNSATTRQMRALMEDSRYNRSMRYAADAGESVIPKVLKNKKFLTIAGASLLAGYLLQPSDSGIKHQEIREESRPKKQPQIDSSAVIDPQHALVTRPEPIRHEKIHIKGKMPHGMNIRKIDQQLGGSIRRGIIDNSEKVDEEYLSKLQYNQSINSWNFNGKQF